ncbi:hypothetical protein BVY12_13730 [Pseudomonas amygdali pv. morsprunorum]|nr:hypothetical protein BVY12_13730 [Pseudomonas amygdali pv. morsprunorum]
MNWLFPVGIGKEIESVVQVCAVGFSRRRAGVSNFFIRRCVGDGCARNSLLMRTKANNVYLMNFSQFRKKDGAWLSGWGRYGFAG